MEMMRVHGRSFKAMEPPTSVWSLALRKEPRNAAHHGIGR